MKTIIPALLIFMFLSCSSAKDITRVDNNMKKLSIGMKKERVSSIMGKDYEIIASKEGIIVLGYKSPDNGIYKLTFVNGRLTEWEKEWFPTTTVIKKSN
ncbi:hypothetical protein LJB95_02080 [Paludibacteraceae bacterium OttesenSCG-928-F17]|nr:hypothetical protein [Paludibacteraceae bacterium OttesenSCG-928-F17]